MKLIVAVHRDPTDGSATVAGVGFDDWSAPEALRSHTSRVTGLTAPAKGQPDLRDVVCVQALLREHALAPELVVIDGFVHLDAQESPGLGAQLHQALNAAAAAAGAPPVAVMGVAKGARPALSAQYEVMREEETRPLLVTCAGIDLGSAKARLRAMHGRRRLPTLIKLAARLAKGTAEAD